MGTETPASGIIGDDQEIMLCLRRVAALPAPTWEGVPFLGDDDEAT